MTMIMAPMIGLLLLWIGSPALANPHSRPYIAFRTSAFDQESFVDHQIDWSNPIRVTSEPHPLHRIPSTQCPLQFSLGVSKRLHDADNVGGNAIHQAPVIYPVFPARGPGRQVLYTTDFEHLDLLTPASLETPGQAVKEALIQASEYPLLMESSSFLTSPIIHDVNGDGRPDAIVTDYDGGISIVGLTSVGGAPRYFHGSQVPRLYVRREWVERRVNETLQDLGLLPKIPAPLADDKKEKAPDDPYHSYFEYYHSTAGEPVLQGVSANLMGQDHAELAALKQRRSRRVHHHNNTKPRYKRHDEDDYRGEELYSEEDDFKALDDLERGQVRDWKGHLGRREVWDDSIDGDDSHDFDDHSVRGGAAAVSRDLASGDAEEAAHRRLQEVPDEPETGAAEHQEQGHDAVPEHQNVEQHVHEEQVVQESIGVDGQEHVAEAGGQGEPDHQEQEHEAPPEHVERQAQVEQIVQEAIDADGQEHVAESVQQGGPDHHEHAPEHVGGEQVQQVHEEVVDTGARGVRAGEAAIEPDTVEHQAREDAERHHHEEVHNKVGSGDHRSRDREAELERQRREYDGEDVKGWDDHAYDDVANVDLQKGGDDMAMDDPEYGILYDDARVRGEYDDYYGSHNSANQEYYDTKHYIRITPHILCTPVLAEIPKLYSNTNEKDDVLIVAVSYYLDEDEYEGFFSYSRFQGARDHGDETEASRGSYIASAIMAYTLGTSSRWSGQTHLDLSTDYTSPENATVVGAIPIGPDVSMMGAFALSSPAVADIDGDGNLEVIVGTSMGIVYAFDARQMYKKAKWPIQMQHPVESRILVEDVVGSTNLEIFVADIGGNVVCFDHEANPIWHRDLAASFNTEEKVMGSSPMTLGDVDGDGLLDIVLVLKIGVDKMFLFAISAITGRDLPNFPIQLDEAAITKSLYKTDKLHHKLTQPLLVDLHAEQSFLDDYLHRNGGPFRAQARKSSKSAGPPHGGYAPGLHIVLPSAQTLYIIEGGSGCSQTVSVGDAVSAMVQVDDVHGTNRLDLVVTTEAGDTITLESASPYHPLNTWNHGELRGRMNGNTHGYSASQGIFVHEQSRQYVDIFGVYVPVTFEIFDNRPNIRNEPDKQVYAVEIRDGTSSKRVLRRNEYKKTGVYTEKVYIPSGPGYYSLSVVLHTSHGLLYEDTFHIGYNVHFMSGFDILLWLPLFIASATIFFCGVKKTNWNDDDFVDDDRNGHNLGILGRTLAS